jgi:hypothetical protein
MIGHTGDKELNMNKIKTTTTLIKDIIKYKQFVIDNDYQIKCDSIDKYIYNILIEKNNKIKSFDDVSLDSPSMIDICIDTFIESYTEIITAIKPKLSLSYTQIDNMFVPQKKLNISKHIFPNYLDVLKNMPQQDYIICVGYDSKERREWQIGITGSCIKSKDKILQKSYYFDNASRELGEEVGLKINNPDIRYTRYAERVEGKNGKMFYKIKICFPINVKNTTPITYEEYKESFDNINYGKLKDDKTRKVSCLVHGNYDEITKKIKEIKYYLHTKDGQDTNLKLSIVRVDLLYNIVKMYYQK